jgi:MarR family transcriptional regulator, lower aerobic nicotinate degradation pathway regulator
MALDRRNEDWPGMARKRSRMTSNGETPISEDDGRLLAMPGHLIRRLQQISFALFVDQARAFETTPVQYAAIVAINNHPGIDQTALCNIVALDRSTVGDVVGRLEKKKLIRRLSGLVDRRTKSLYVTPAGRKLIEDIEPAVQSTQRLILAPLKASERGVFLQMLKTLVHLNNEHSRAPLRLVEARQRQSAIAAGAITGRRNTRPRLGTTKNAAAE